MPSYIGSIYERDQRNRLTKVNVGKIAVMVRIGESVFHNQRGLPKGFTKNRVGEV